MNISFVNANLWNRSFCFVLIIVGVVVDDDDDDVVVVVLNSQLPICLLVSVCGHLTATY